MNRPTRIVLIVRNESTIAEVILKPSFEVTSPKVMNTSGETIKRARNQIVLNFSSLLAHTALMELAERATKTALRMKNQVLKNAI